MPTDFNAPVLSDTYANFLSLMKARDVDIALWFDSTGSLNVPTGAKGWDSANSKFIKYNGSAWVDLATTYGISVAQLNGLTSGNASGNIPVSNGTKNVNLNADLLDGANAGTAAGNVLLLDGSGKAPSTIFPNSGVTAGTFRSVTVTAGGVVTAGTNPTTLAGYGITDAAKNDGTGATGTWSISVSGSAASAATATSAGKWTTARTLTLGLGLRGSVSIDGSANFTLSAQLAFGAASTAGSADYNDSTNLVAGYSPRLMTLTDTNGPGVSGQGHLMNVEYSTKDGSGNIFQMSVPYTSTGDMWFRNRVSGVWSSWQAVLDSSNYNNYAPTKTGGGATGTWGISISGNAGTATTATNATHANKAGGLDTGITTDGAITVNGTLNIASSNALTWTAYGIGLYASDPTWIRTQNNASIYAGTGVIRSDTSLQAGGSGQFTATAAGVVTAAGNITAGGKLFGNGGTKGYGKITLTTTPGTPSGGTDGDFVFVYA